MRLIPLACDEFLPLCQSGGNVIEVNKLVSALQDDVQSRVLDPPHLGRKGGQASGLSSGARAAFYLTWRSPAFHQPIHPRVWMVCPNLPTESELEAI